MSTATVTAAAETRPVSGPKTVLHLEGAAVLGAASAAYFATGGGWVLFAVLFLAPDLSMLGYLAGKRAGAVAYDAAHNYVLPLGLLAVGYFGTAPLATSIALIWIAHVGFDRMLGYGLKYAEGFRSTHLHRV
jgi:hypothetical protein